MLCRFVLKEAEAERKPLASCCGDKTISNPTLEDIVDSAEQTFKAAPEAKQASAVFAAALFLIFLYHPKVSQVLNFLFI